MFFDLTKSVNVQYERRVLSVEEKPPFARNKTLADNEGMYRLNGIVFVWSV